MTFRECKDLIKSGQIGVGTKLKIRVRPRDTSQYYLIFTVSNIKSDSTEKVGNEDSYIILWGDSVNSHGEPASRTVITNEDVLEVLE